MSIDKESHIAFNTPAVFTNRFSLAVGVNGGIRIAFAEAAPGETKAFHFHSAIITSMTDAEALAATLVKMIRIAKGEETP